MADINNSLALGIKADPIDIGKTLLTAGQINEMRAKTSLEEAATANTQQETYQKQSDLRGRAANEIYNDPSDAGVQRAFQHWEAGGAPLDSLTKQRILAMPPAQRRATAAQIRAGAMPSSTNMELDPSQIAQRSQSQAGGALAGSIYGAPGAAGYQPPRPAAPSSARAPNEEPAPDVSLLERKGAAEGAAQLSQDQIKRYGVASESAANQKVALRQIMLDADKVRTGAGSYNEQALRKWIQAAGDYIPGLKDLAGASLDKQVAAFEGIEKNGGLVSREAMKGVGGTAASELSAISGTLVGTSTSHGGITNNASQLIGLKNSEMARYQAAQDYLNKNQTLKGFDAHFAKNAGPAAWVYMALPPEERQSIRDNLKKTTQGQGVLNSIARQMNYIHTHKLDEGLE